MSDFESLLQNRASSTSFDAAVWSGWASSQYGANRSRGLTRRKTAARARRFSERVGSRLRFGSPRFSRQGSPSAALAAAVSSGAAGGVAQRRRLAAGQVEDADLPPLGDQPGDRPPHAELGVVGVRGDDEGVEHRRRAPPAIGLAGGLIDSRKGKARRKEEDRRGNRKQGKNGNEIVTPDRVASGVRIPGYDSEVRTPPRSWRTQP